MRQKAANMKTVKRIGVFETNSSSTHTLSLVSKDVYEADKATEKPKYRRHAMIASKQDKLYMACGCCEELFLEEERMADYASWEGDDQQYQIERKRDYDEVKNALAEGRGDEIYMDVDNTYYEVAMGLIMRVYCELTGADYDKTYQTVDKKNHSGRACHMKFFREGALDDEQSHYLLFVNLLEGNESDVLNALRYYFDDANVLLYREFYAGVGMYDDDD